MADDTPATPITKPVSVPTDPRGDRLAYGAVILLALIIVLLFFKGVPDGTTGTLIVGMATGVLALVTGVYGFQFGSSKGSQAKDAQIAAMTPPPAS